MLSKRCLAGSDLLSAEICSDQCSPSTLRMVSPILVSPQLHIALQILHDGYKLQHFNGKSYLLTLLTILQQYHISHPWTDETSLLIV